MKPHTILFGEAMPRAAMDEAERRACAADLFVVLGSSLTVYPAAYIPVHARRAGATLVIVNLEPTPLDGEAQLVVERLQPTGDGEFYELWLLNSADDLVSLGSFRVPETGRTTVALPLPVDADRFRFFDVSREPLDGNPGHSSESVLRGPTV